MEESNEEMDVLFVAALLVFRLGVGECARVVVGAGVDAPEDGTDAGVECAGVKYESVEMYC